MPRFSLPTLELNRAGATVTQIAGALGVSRQYVSLMLAGTRTPHPALLHVIRGIAGPETAERIELLMSEGGEIE